MPTPLDLALSYVERLGWPVFPCRPRDKRPLTEHGFKDASLAPDQLRAWWADWPEANIGLPTGAPLGIVLDCDPRNGGELDALPARPRTPLAVTGGGGNHLVFACPDFKPLATAGQGYDVKAAGGYIVAPYSVHPSGERYRWLVTPRQCRVADCPDWLLERIRPKAAPATPARYQVPSADREDRVAAAVRYLSRCPGGGQGEGEHGGRDRRVYAAACKLLQHFGDLADGLLLSLLTAWDAESNFPALGATDVQRKFYSALKGAQRG